MNVDEVRQILFVLLSQYNVSFDDQQIGNSFIFEVSQFGVKIVYLDGQLFDKKILNGWNTAWVHPDYSIEKSREVIVWALVQGGYFHYLRHNFKNTFNKILTFEGWGKRLIDERLRVYKDHPKYNYFRELNKDAKNEAESFVLSMDPGFYDTLIDIN